MFFLVFCLLCIDWHSIETKPLTYTLTIPEPWEGGNIGSLPLLRIEVNYKPKNCGHIFPNITQVIQTVTETQQTSTTDEIVSWPPHIQVNARKNNEPPALDMNYVMIRKQMENLMKRIKFSTLSKTLRKEIANAMKKQTENDEDKNHRWVIVKTDNDTFIVQFDKQIRKRNKTTLVPDQPIFKSRSDENITLMQNISQNDIQSISHEEGTQPSIDETTQETSMYLNGHSSTSTISEAYELTFDETSSTMIDLSSSTDMITEGYPNTPIKMIRKYYPNDNNEGFVTMNLKRYRQ